MQIFVRTLSSKSLALSVSPSDTVEQLKQMLEDREGVPCGELRLLHNSTPLLAPGRTLGEYKVGSHSTVQMLLGLNGAGGDGGATCNDRLWVDMRKDILNAQGDGFEMALAADKSEITRSLATTCCISSVELQEPIVCCELGMLYSQEALIEHVVAKTVPERFAHVTSMRDVIKCAMTRKSETTENKHGQTASSAGGMARQDAPFKCPITHRDMNGTNRFCVIRTSGVVLSTDAVKQLCACPEADGTVLCPVTGKPFNANEDVIRIYPDKDEVIVSKERMAARKKLAKTSKKNKKKARKAVVAAGGEAAAALAEQEAVEAKDIERVKLQYVGKVQAEGGVDKRKMSAYSGNKIAQETEANLKRMKGSGAHSALFGDHGSVSDGKMTANDLFTRSNGMIGMRM